MSLDENNLTGSIPPELGDLFQLVDLDLSYNQLTGNIPIELRKLKNLETLSLGHNPLSGCFPSGLSAEIVGIPDGMEFCD